MLTCNSEVWHFMTTLQIATKCSGASVAWPLNKPVAGLLFPNHRMSTPNSLATNRHFTGKLLAEKHSEWLWCTMAWHSGQFFWPSQYIFWPQGRMDSVQPLGTKPGGRTGQRVEVMRAWAHCIEGGLGMVALVENVEVQRL